MISAVAVLLGFGVIFWILLGRPTRQRQAVSDRGRRGGRSPATTLLMPTRDREYVPGLLLVVVAVWQLAGVIADNASEAGAQHQLVALVVLSAVIAVGYSVQRDLVGAGLGLIGGIALVLNRLGADACTVYTPHQNQVFMIAAAGAAVVLIGLRFAITPVREARRYLTGPVSFAWSPGRAKPVGPVAATLLGLLGVLDLVDLATRPGTLQGLQQSGSWPVVAALLGLSVIVLVAVTALPTFTLSVLGLGVVAADLAVNLLGAGCESWTLRLVCLVSLLLLNRLLAPLVR